MRDEDLFDPVDEDEPRCREKQRRGIDRLLERWVAWKQSHPASNFEIEEAIGRVNDAFEALSELLED